MPVSPENTWIRSACVAVAVEWQTNPVAQLHCLARPIPQRCSKSEAVQDLPSPGLKTIRVTAGNRATVLLDNDGFHSCVCQPCRESQTAARMSVAASRQATRMFIDVRTLMVLLPRLRRLRVLSQASCPACYFTSLAESISSFADNKVCHLKSLPFSGSIYDVIVFRETVVDQ
jgi:hypothetical protein